MIQIMQGDSYGIPVTVRRDDGQLVDEYCAEAVEIIIGSIRKVYPGQITFSDGKWIFPLTQEESMQLSAQKQTAQIRVRFTSGDVVGAKSGIVFVDCSKSGEVL